MVHYIGITIDFLRLMLLVLVLACMGFNFRFVSGEIRCIEREREALLKFKQGLRDGYGLLSSWGSEDDRKECCEWKRVRCSNTTGHVTALLLYFGGLGGKISSALLELHHLNYLDLSENDFGGIRIPEFIGSIKRLEHLDLSVSNFSGSIPPQLGNLTDLRRLSLGGNQLDGPIPNAFGNLSFLESLDLRINNLEGGIPKSLLSLSHLQELSLSWNDLGGPLEESFGNQSCKAMEKLDLSYNQLTGSVPDLRACSELRFLSLDHNKLTGSVPSSLGHLSKLEYLDLSSNSLEGTFSEAHFMKLHNLRELKLSFNSLTLEFSRDWIPPFLLKSLRLASCKLGPSFPTWLRTQSSLSSLDISDAGISDVVPKWFWNLSPAVSFLLNVSHNQISGTIPDLSSSLIIGIDVSFNKFSGPLPLLHPDTLVVQFSQNMFSGSISSVCKISNRKLMFLDLSNNQLTGVLPNCWEELTELIVLNLNNNNLSSEIPLSLGSVWRLQTLHLSGNNLVGELPSTLKNCLFLQLIDVGGNKLTGKIPSWLVENYVNMTYLSLRQNRFYGDIPPEICNLTQIQMLDLSRNSISGEIPQCFNNFNSLVDKSRTTINWISIPIGDDYIDYALVQWKGQELEYKNTLELLKLIDLSSNKLVGNIPKTFSNLSRLISLNLSRNHLEGNIDQNIGQMDMLECLDLSRNQLSGEIPISLANLHYLAVLDLANNNLTGKIPTSTQLQSFNASVYAGNNALCGLPLALCPRDRLVPSINDQGEHIEKKDDGFWSLSIMEEFGISMAFGFIVGFWGVVGSLALKRSWRTAYFNFLDGVGDWLYVTTTILLRKFTQS